MNSFLDQANIQQRSSVAVESLSVYHDTLFNNLCIVYSIIRHGTAWQMAFKWTGLDLRIWVALESRCA
jgi:hypothetical protein